MPLVCWLLAGTRVIDVLDGEVELVVVMLGLAAKFHATVGEY
jgi:hypothetical protein